MRTDSDGRWPIGRLAGIALVFAVAWFLLFRIGFGGTGNVFGNYGAAFLVAGGIAACAIALTILTKPWWSEWLTRPFMGEMTGEGTEVEKVPLYSTAESRRKQGRYAEAIQEAQRQLDQFPGDLRGTLLIAEIQAVDCRDLVTASATLRDWLDRGSAEPGSQAVALTRLADWHLRLGRDIESARECLSEIIRRFPESQASFMAEQQLAHLASGLPTGDDVIPLREGMGRPLAPGVPPPAPDRQPKAAAEATELVEHLKLHPHDMEARERLARIYAWEYRKMDLARMELETLLGYRHAGRRDAARWLNLWADMEIQVAGDLKAARKALDRLIDLDPNAAAAEQARHRTMLLPREMARHAQTRVVSGTTRTADNR